MSSTVFMVDGDNKLTALSRTPYDSEDLFQRLLADHPMVLAGATGASGDGRLLLVRREAPVPEQDAGAGRWSLDHLFVDQDGVPVLVEIKRSSDTRARREVVAQMLDYAANGVAYWPIEQLIAGFQTTSEAAGEPADDRLSAFLQGRDADAFWRQVEANLRSGRVRMVIVADKIGHELRRIVEFLNEQMRPAEMLAIEVEQHTTTDGLRLLSPRVLGATERAATTKAIRATPPPMAVNDWIDDVASTHGAEAGAAARRALDWFTQNGFEVGLTKTQDALFARLTRPDGKPTWPFFVRRSTGRLETSLQYLKDNPAFASDDTRAAILEAVRAVSADVVSTSKLTGWPAIPLSLLSDDGVWDRFVAVAETIVARNKTG